MRLRRNRSERGRATHVRRRFLTVEALEDRTAPSTFTVLNLADSGSEADVAINQDATLTETLRLSSGTTLDCQGHTLRPLAPGKTPSGSSPIVPSVPEVGILLDDVAGVTIKNCVIDGFDFGIVAVNHEEAEPSDALQLAARRTNIRSNSISSLYQGITVIEADNIDVVGNTIESKSSSGAGVNVMLDSDLLAIRSNLINGRHRGVNLHPTPLYPGSPNLEYLAGDGIVFSQAPDTIDVQVGGTAHTFVKALSQRATNNLVEHNSIVFQTNSQRAIGIFVSEFQDGLIIRNNLIQGGAEGIALGFFTEPLPDQAFWSRNVIIENNSIDETTFPGIVAKGSFDPVVRGNVVTNVVAEDSSGAIVLHGKALETATITRNIVRSSPHGLSLGADDATFFGAKVFLNDFVETKFSAVNVASTYPFLSELSFNGQGNYWGRRCDDSGGFRDADEGPRPKVDSPLSFVTDSHPYGEPVANTPDASLPATCNGSANAFSDITVSGSSLDAASSAYWLGASESIGELHIPGPASKPTGQSRLEEAGGFLITLVDATQSTNVIDAAIGGAVLADLSHHDEEEADEDPLAQLTGLEVSPLSGKFLSGK